MEFLSANKSELANYKTDVLASHKAMKEEAKTFGYSIKLLLQFKDKMPASHVKMLKAFNNNDELYSWAKDNVRMTSSGNYTAFYLRQLLHKVAQGKISIVTPEMEAQETLAEEIAKQSKKNKAAALKAAEARSEQKELSRGQKAAATRKANKAKKQLAAA